MNVWSWVAWRLLALGVVPPRLLATRVSAFEGRNTSALSQARGRSRADFPSIVCVPRMLALETVFSQQYLTARFHDDSCYAELLQMHRLSPDLACSHVRTHNHHPLASFISGEESYTPKVTMRVDAFAAVGSQMSPRLPPCRPFLLAEGEGDRLVALQIYFLHRRRMM